MVSMEVCRQTATIFCAYEITIYMCIFSNISVLFAQWLQNATLLLSSGLRVLSGETQKQSVPV